MPRLLKIILLLLVTCNLSLVSASLVHAATSISLTTQTPRVKVNQTFDVSINLTSTDTTLGTDIVLKYDPQILELTSVTPGTLYPNYPPNVSGQTTTGQVNISAVSDFSSGVTPNGTFATLKFTPLKAGQTEVIFAYAPGDTALTGVIPLEGNTPNLLVAAPSPLAITIQDNPLANVQTSASNLRLLLTLSAIAVLAIVIFLMFIRRKSPTPTLPPTPPPPTPLPPSPTSA